MKEKVVEFFENSMNLDRQVTRQLSHIRFNWELTWNMHLAAYENEEDSFAGLLNALVHELSELKPSAKYHDSEDRLAQHCKEKMGWDIKKQNRYWVGADYPSILEQGSFDDIDQEELCLAASGRIKAAFKFGQVHFDQMEMGHQIMLADVIAIILYHRVDKC